MGTIIHRALARSAVLTVLTLYLIYLHIFGFFRNFFPLKSHLSMFLSLPNTNATLVFQSDCEAYLLFTVPRYSTFTKIEKSVFFIFHLLLPFLLPVKPVISVLLPPVEPVMERSAYRMRGQ